MELAESALLHELYMPTGLLRGFPPLHHQHDLPILDHNKHVRMKFTNKKTVSLMATTEIEGVIRTMRMLTIRRLYSRRWSPISRPITLKGVRRIAFRTVVHLRESISLPFVPCYSAFVLTVPFGMFT